MPKINELAPIRRSISFVPSSVDKKNRTIDFTLATDTDSVYEYNWELGKRIRTVLVMDDESAVIVPEQVPMLDTHNDWTTDSQLGAFRKVGIEHGNQGELSELVMRAHFGKTKKAEKNWIEYSEGRATNCSVRYKPLSSPEIIYEGSVQVGGRTLTATRENPIALVKRWRVEEGSLCPLGADNNSGSRSLKLPESNDINLNISVNTGSSQEPEPITNFSRGEKEQMPKPKTDGNTPETKDTQAPKTEPQRSSEPVKTPEQIRKEALEEGKRAERTRREGIRSVCSLADYPAEETEKLLSDEEMTSERAMEVVKEWKRKEFKPFSQTHTTEIRGGNNRGIEHIRKIGGAAMAGCVNPHIESAIEAVDLEKFRSGGINKVVRNLLVAHGVDVSEISTNGELADAIFSRAYVANDFANMTKDAANVLAVTSMNEAPTVYHQLCKIGTLDNYLPHHRVGLKAGGALGERNENGEFPVIELGGDNDSTIQASAKSGTMKITKETFINGQIKDVLELAGTVTYRAEMDIERAVFGLLTSNKIAPGSSTVIFHADNGNLVAADDVDSESVALARAAMAAQAENGANLGLFPRFILTGAKQAINAYGLATSTADPEGLNAGVANFFNSKNKRGLIPLETFVITDNSWFLFCPYIMRPHLEVGFVNGVRKPTVNVYPVPGWAGVQVDISLDYGIKCHNVEGIVKNPKS